MIDIDNFNLIKIGIYLSKLFGSYFLKKVCYFLDNRYVKDMI